MTEDRLMREAALQLKGTRKLVVLTGAGVSKESGIPTFRDAQDGLWARYDPMDLATREGFLRNPAMVWEWYSYRFGMVEGARPNPGHVAIAEMEGIFPQVSVITQNIDGLHQAAGSTNVVELHGNIRRYKCLDGRHTGFTRAGLAAQTQIPPVCPHCGALLRPDVVWFGELLPADAIHRAFDLCKGCDAMLVVGASGEVEPAASLPVHAAHSGALVIDVNPDRGQNVRWADIFLEGPSGEILPRLVEALRIADCGLGSTTSPNAQIPARGVSQPRGYIGIERGASMSDSVLIRNGTLITPGGELRGDLLITGEEITAIGLALASEGASRIVDASGCIVLPGVIDPHTHIQLDTGIYKTPDDWEAGTRTAACGGVTTVIDFATQLAGQDVRQALDARRTEIGGLAQIDYGLHMMLTTLPESDGELEGWMGDLLAAGVNSAKVYTTYRPNYYEDDAALLRVLRAAAREGVVVMVHCENDSLVSAATSELVRAGQTSLANHGRARPALAEVEAANRVLFLADAVGAMHSQKILPQGKLAASDEIRAATGGLARNASPLQVYIVHCSVSGTVNQVILAGARGQDAIAETTPQYLLLDETVYSGEHPEWGIMQPPLRSPEEKELLWAQVASGAIATIGTDHCDYTIAQKRLSPKFTETSGGIPGLETMLPLLVTHGVMQGRISWSRLAELTGANPARVFGLPRKGVLAPGYDADLVIYDPRIEGTIRAERLHNLAGYSPYQGWHVRGAVRDVFCRGRRLVRDGEFVPATGWGCFVPAARSK